MKFLRSFRVLILLLLFISMVGVGKTPSTRADDPLTFSSELQVYWSHFGNFPIDSDWYTVYVQAGETVELTLSYRAFVPPEEMGLLRVFIGTEVDRLVFLMPPNPPWPFPVFSGTNIYTRVMPATEAIQIGLELSGSHRFPFQAGAKVTYDLTISGATLTPPPTILVDPIIAAEEAAGLQRVQDNSLPVVIYTPMPDNPDRFIDIRDLDGNPILYISADDLAALPEFPIENILIASDGLVSIYKLTTGEYQVNVGPLPDGKVHVIIFDAIPRTHTYGYTWTPMPE